MGQRLFVRFKEVKILFEEDFPHYIFPKSKNLHEPVIVEEKV